MQNSNQTLIFVSVNRLSVVGRSNHTNRNPGGNFNAVQHALYTRPLHHLFPRDYVQLTFSLQNEPSEHTFSNEKKNQNE